MAAAHVSFHLCYFSKDIFNSLLRNKGPGHILSACGRQWYWGSCMGFRSSARCSVSTTSASVGPPQVPLLTHRIAKSLQCFPDMCQIWSGRTSSRWEWTSRASCTQQCWLMPFFFPEIQPRPRRTRQRPPAIQTVHLLYQVFFQKPLT